MRNIFGKFFCKFKGVDQEVPFKLGTHVLKKVAFNTSRTRLKLKTKSTKQQKAKWTIVSTLISRTRLMLDAGV